ncbi:MAG: hypothetical protein KIT18_12950 [Burkholderiales bacterium]|nr:hypothetical protein [Burkholderiales bacterium]
MSRNDLKALQNPLLLLIVVALLAAGAVYYSDTLLRQARQQLSQQQKLLTDARMRLQRSGDEKEIIVRYLGAYQQLARAGFVGEEQRINWLDGLRIANQQADLFGVDYQISAQKPYPYANEFNPGQLALMHSEMKLRFRLLHEGDLMQLFGALARQGVGVFSIDYCSMRRADSSNAIRYQPNLSAECDLSWITVRPTSEKKP